MKILTLLLLSFCLSNQYYVSGIVVDTLNNKIPDVNIFTNDSGTSTDTEGYYSLKCNENDTISFTAIGFKTIIKLATSIKYKIVMSNTPINNQEIKVYGHINKKSFKHQSTTVLNSFLINQSRDINIENIINKIPNFNYSGGTSRPRYFQIRGLGELSQFNGQGAPHFYIGYRVDDIDFTGIGMLGDLYDINQIEIFKGPHSTVFGSNALGGAINIISNNPNSNMNEKILYSFSSDNGYKLAGVTSNKINKKIIARHTFIKNYSDGFTKNIFYNENNTNEKNETILRSKILFNSSIKMNHLLTMYYIDYNNKYDQWSPNNEPHISYSNYQGYDRQKSKAISVNSKYSINIFDINHIISYSDNKIFYSYDADWANDLYWSDNYNWNPENQNQFEEEACNEDYSGTLYCFWAWDYIDDTSRYNINKSNEIRFNKDINNRNSLTFGLYLSETNERDIRNGWIFKGSATYINSQFKINKYSYYFQHLYQISDNLNIDVSFRDDLNEIHLNQYTHYDDGYNPITNQTTQYYGIKDNDLISGKIKIDYLYTNHSTISFSISKGMKSSGVNQSTSLSSENQEFNEGRYYIYEENINIETGITLNNNNYHIELTSFYMHRDNPQVRMFHQYDLEDPSSFDYLTLNSDYGYIRGLEYNLTLKLDNLTLYNNFGCLFDSYISPFTFDNIQYGGRRTAHSPKHTYLFGLKHNISDNILHNIEISGKSSFYYDEQFNYKSKNYNIVNSTLTYLSKDTSVSLWCNNLFNIKYPVRGYTFVLDPSYEIKNFQSYGQPRHYGITITYNL